MRSGYGLKQNLRLQADKLGKNCHPCHFKQVTQTLRDPTHIHKHRPDLTNAELVGKVSSPSALYESVKNWGSYRVGDTEPHSKGRQKSGCGVEAWDFGCPWEGRHGVTNPRTWAQKGGSLHTWLQKQEAQENQGNQSLEKWEGLPLSRGEKSNPKARFQSWAGTGPGVWQRKGALLGQPDSGAENDSRE